MEVVNDKHPRTVLGTYSVQYTRNLLPASQLLYSSIYHKFSLLLEYHGTCTRLLSTRVTVVLYSYSNTVLIQDNKLCPTCFRNSATSAKLPRRRGLGKSSNFSTSKQTAIWSAWNDGYATDPRHSHINRTVLLESWCQQTKNKSDRDRVLVVADIDSSRAT